MTGFLSILIGGGGKPVVTYIGGTSGNGGTAQTPSGAQVGDLGVFATPSGTGLPPAMDYTLWSVSDNGSTKLYYRILTAGDVNRQQVEPANKPWAYVVYRGPGNAGFRSRTGYTKSPSHIGTIVYTSATATGAQYVDRSFPTASGQIDIFDNFAPLTPYTDGQQLSASGTAIVVEMLSI